MAVYASQNDSPFPSAYHAPPKPSYARPSPQSRSQSPSSTIHSTKSHKTAYSSLFASGLQNLNTEDYDDFGLRTSGPTVGQPIGKEHDGASEKSGRKKGFFSLGRLGFGHGEKEREKDSQKKSAKAPLSSATFGLHPRGQSTPVEEILEYLVPPRKIGRERRRSGSVTSGMSAFSGGSGMSSEGKAARILGMGTPSVPMGGKAERMLGMNGSGNGRGVKESSGSMRSAKESLYSYEDRGRTLGPPPRQASQPTLRTESHTTPRTQPPPAFPLPAPPQSPPPSPHPSLPQSLSPPVSSWRSPSPFSISDRLSWSANINIGQAALEELEQKEIRRQQKTLVIQTSPPPIRQNDKTMTWYSNTTVSSNSDSGHSHHNTLPPPPVPPLPRSNSIGAAWFSSPTTSYRGSLAGLPESDDLDYAFHVPTSSERGNSYASFPASTWTAEPLSPAIQNRNLPPSPTAANYPFLSSVPPPTSAWSSPTHSPSSSLRRPSIASVLTSQPLSPNQRHQSPPPPMPPMPMPRQQSPPPPPMPPTTRTSRSNTVISSASSGTRRYQRGNALNALEGRPRMPRPPPPVSSNGRGGVVRRAGGSAPPTMTDSRASRPFLDWSDDEEEAKSGAEGEEEEEDGTVTPRANDNVDCMAFSHPFAGGLVTPASIPHSPSSPSSQIHMPRREAISSPSGQPLNRTTRDSIVEELHQPLSNNRNRDSFASSTMSTSPPSHPYQRPGSAATTRSSVLSTSSFRSNGVPEIDLFPKPPQAAVGGGGSRMGRKNPSQESFLKLN